MSTKQRMISASDLALPAYQRLPDEAKPTALGLWLHLDPLGRGPMDPAWIASRVYPTRPLGDAAEMVFEHLVMLLDAGFIATYSHDGAEWIVLLHPLKVDMRGVTISTPEPPEELPRTPSMDVHGLGARAGGRERARERARAEVRAEDGARAEAWAAVERDRVREPRRPDRPLLLDAPPAFCSEHMPAGTTEKCGPCRDARVVRDDYLTRRVYEERLGKFYEATQGDDEPF